MIQMFADRLASRFKPCLNRVSIAIFLVVTFGGLNGSEADVKTIAKVELATADFALTPDEKFAIVICYDEKDWPRPTNSSQPRKLPTELFLFDAESGEAVGKKSIANGVVACIAFNDRVFVVSNPPNLVVELDLKTLERKSSHSVSGSAEALYRCGDSHLVIGSQHGLSLRRASDFDEVFHSPLPVEPEYFDEISTGQTLVDFHEGLVKLGGLWFDIEKRKVVGLNNGVSFLDLNLFDKDHVGRGVWDTRIENRRECVSPTARWSMPRSRRWTTSWRFPCVFQIGLSKDRENVNLNILDIHDGSNIDTIPVVETPSKLYPRMVVPKLGSLDLFVLINFQVLRVGLPLAKLDSQRPHLSIRQEKLIAPANEVVKFNVSMTLPKSISPNEISYELDTLLPGISCSSTGQVTIDSPNLLAKLSQRLKSQDFRMLASGKSQETFATLFGSTTRDAPIAIPVPVLAKRNSQTISRATYCVLLMVPPELQQENSDVAGVLSEGQDSQASSPVKFTSAQKSQVEAELRNRLSSAEKRQADMERTWRASANKLDQNANEIRSLLKSIEQLETLRNSAEENLDQLRVLDEKTQRLQVELADELKNFKDDYARLARESEQMRSQLVYTRLAALLSAGFIVFAGIVGYLIIAARKMVL